MQSDAAEDGAPVAASPPQKSASFWHRHGRLRWQSLRQWTKTRPRLARWLLAGPGALAAGLLFTAAMPVWLPEGNAGVDNLVWPLVLGPLVWVLFLLYAVVEENVPRGLAVVAGSSALNGILIAVTMA